MRNILAVFLVLTIGCGSAAPIRFGGIKDPAFRVEDKPPPPRPDKDPIPPEKDWAIPLVKGAVAPKGGVLLSAEKAVRAAKYKARYNEAITLWDLDKKVWKNVRVIHEERFGQANRVIKDLTPGWWDNNKGVLGWTAGFVVGSAVTILILYGVDRVDE